MAVDLSFFRSETSQRLRAEGRAEGVAEGIVEGHAEWLLRLLAGRKIPVSDETRDRIRACTDTALLDKWFDRALNAESAVEIFH